MRRCCTPDQLPRIEWLSVDRDRVKQDESEDGGGWFGRHGIGLAYHNQRVNSPRSAAAPSSAIRLRMMGSEDGMDEPDKPNGMHWSTYNRVLDQADELDDLGGLSAVGGLLLSAG
jgi:hypothetical protein